MRRILGGDRLLSQMRAPDQLMSLENLARRLSGASDVERQGVDVFRGLARDLRANSRFDQAATVDGMALEKGRFAVTLQNMADRIREQGFR